MNTYFTPESSIYGKIYGIVYDYMTLEPIEDALVGIRENDIRVATNANGEYIIRHIGNGEYTIFAEIKGYEQREKIAVVANGGTLSLDFALVKNPKTGEIAGIVSDIETSHPVVDASIRLIGSCTMQTKSDDTGQFLFEEVPEGEYEIITQRLCYKPDTSSITVTHDMTTTIELLLFWQYTYYMYDEEFREILGLFDYGTIISFPLSLSHEIIKPIASTGSPLSIIQCDETSPGPDCLPEDYKEILERFNGKVKIAIARNTKNNDNEKLLYDLTDLFRIHYESQWLEEINSYSYPGWRYPAFHYIETREFENRGTSGQQIIITPIMVVNENKEINLEEGTYFFDSLTLKQGATIITNGNAKIYTTSLKLEKGARLTGGSIHAPEPERLVIIGEYWTGYPYDSTKNNIHIGSGAEVHGYIIAPNLTLYMTGGINKQTVLHGGALVHRFIATGDISSNDQGIKIERACFYPYP